MEAVKENNLPRFQTSIFQIFLGSMLPRELIYPTKREEENHYQTCLQKKDMLVPRRGSLVFGGFIGPFGGPVE